VQRLICYYLRRRRRFCFWFRLFVCLSVCLSVRRITRKLVNGFWRNFWRGRAWRKDQVIQFWWWSGSRFGSGSPKSEIRILRIGGGLCSLSTSSYLRQRRRLCFWWGLFVCLFVWLSVGLLANLWTDFDEIFWRSRHGSRTKWYNFGGDPDHASDLGVQSPKSVSSRSAEVCAVWAYLVSQYIQCETACSPKIVNSKVQTAVSVDPYKLSQ